MPWDVRYAIRAERDIERIPPCDAERIRVAVRGLTITFVGADIQKLAGRDSEWRLRVGRWRVLLDLDNASGEMTVTRVLPRDRAYRD